MRIVNGILKKATIGSRYYQAVTRPTPHYGHGIATNDRPRTISVRFMSAIERTHARSIQVTLESLANAGEGNRDVGGDSDKGGIVRQLLPIGAAVRQGDVIALVRKQRGTMNSNASEDSDRSEEDYPILAPRPGRITQWYTSPSEYISIGEPVLELDNETLLEDVQAWKNHLQSGHHTSRDHNFVTSFLQLEDVFRLQHLVQAIREESSTPPTNRGGIVLSTCVQLYQRIVELQVSDPGEQAQTRTEWGVMLHQYQDYHGALEQFLLALQKRQETYPSSYHPHIVASHFHVGAIYRQLGNLPQALEHIKLALKLQIQDLGHAHHPRIAAGYNTIGAIHFQMGNHLDAKTNYETALAILQELQASSSSNSSNNEAEMAGTHHNLGMALKNLKEFDAAKQHLQTALAIRKQLQQRQSQFSNETSMTTTTNVAASHNALGQLWAEMGNLPVALSEFQSALDLHEQMFGKESPISGAGYNTIGSIHFQMQELDLALQAYRTALTILQRVAPNQEDLAATYNNVGLTLYHLQHYSESLEHYNQSRRILEAIHGKDHPILAMTIGSIGNTLQGLKEYDAAMKEFQTAHAMLEKALGSDHPEIATSFNNMGLLWSQQGQHEQALHSYRSAAAIFTKTLGANHPHTASCHFNLGLVRSSQGELDSAKQEFEKAREIWIDAFGVDHPHVEMAAQRIQECQ